MGFKGDQRQLHMPGSVIQRQPGNVLIRPGYIKTAMTKVYTDDPEYTRYIIGRTPAGMHRLLALFRFHFLTGTGRWGLPEDFRGAVIFLASRASDFCCGMSLVVDGGLIAK